MNKTFLIASVWGASMGLLTFFACCGNLLRADILIVQSVNIDTNGHEKSIERKIYLKNNRMRIESNSTDRHTATVIDLDQHTITQIDLAKGSGTVYEVGKLHDYVSKSASGQTSANVGLESQMFTLAETKCGEHSFDLAIPAFRGSRSFAPHVLDTDKLHGDDFGQPFGNLQSG